jgi:large subunit ribosomal protein L10
MSGRDIKTIPEGKKMAVKELAEKMKNKKTILIASIKNLPSRNFQQIKKVLRGKAEIKIFKKSIIDRAIAASEKGSLQNLKEEVKADRALIFSDMDAFELSGVLTDNQSPAKARAGDIAPEDIDIEPGPTDLIPGPAISELGAVGLKVSVENGKLAIKQPKTLAKKGDEIDDKLAGVLAKLGIEPMNVGLEPIAAYDAESEKIYIGIKIDKKVALEELKVAIGKAFGFAINVGNINEKTVGYFIAKAGLEEKALSAKIGESKVEEVKEESTEGEEKPVEEKKEEIKGEEDLESEETNDTNKKEDAN